MKEARKEWLSVSRMLLAYDIKVTAAKRDGGELIPKTDAQAGVRALLAWHTIAQSEALRNALPECEGKNKFEMAAILDNEIRSSIYRNFKTGVEIGKIPDWMGDTATAHVKQEKPINLDEF